MAKGVHRDRKLVLWKDGEGFYKKLGKFTLNFDEAQIFYNMSEVVRAEKALMDLKEDSLPVFEYIEVKERKKGLRNGKKSSKNVEGEKA